MSRSKHRVPFVAATILWLIPMALLAEDAPSARQARPGPAQDAQSSAALREEAVAGLRRGTQFMRSIADHGGYAWVASPDGKLKHGEGVAPPGTVWVQPPGTPAVGLAFLEAYQATGDRLHLDAARDVAQALVRGQLRSGGWNYRIDFEAPRRGDFVYRDGPQGGRESIPPTPAPGGWDVWKQRKFRNDMTIVDDDTTPAALRLLMRVDQALEFKDAAVHEAVGYALESTGNAQYPIGAWSHNYDRFPLQRPSESHYPVQRASFPQEWSRTWTKDFHGCYMLNDGITTRMIEAMLLAHRIYGDSRWLEAAKRGGQFLILAQMPDPQPAWCQEYDRHMQPVWDRKFEPPAITGWESQEVMETLLVLYRETGDRQYLEPVPRALAYLQKSLLPDGRLARFYELRTNRPLFFTKDYQLTYDGRNVPEHYGFRFPSRLERIEAELRRCQELPLEELRAQSPLPGFAARGKPSVARVQEILQSQRNDGAWLEPGRVRDAQGKLQTPKEGIVDSNTFIENVGALSRFVQATAAN